jgi:hypothetical protein
VVVYSTTLASENPMMTAWRGLSSSSACFLALAVPPETIATAPLARVATRAVEVADGDDRKREKSSFRLRRLVATVQKKLNEQD